MISVTIGKKETLFVFLEERLTQVSTESEDLNESEVFFFVLEHLKIYNNINILLQEC